MKEKPGRRPWRRFLVGLAWMAAGMAIAWLVLADPLHLHLATRWIPGAGPAAPDTAVQAASDDRQSLWTCGMHPQVVENEPGTCPICGMDLVALAQETPVPDATMPAADETIWTCGMCPQVLEPEPGACPVCGMDLVPRKGEPSAACCPEDHPEGGNDRGAVVTIDPTVVQNIGVVTEVADRRDISRRIRTVGYLDYDQEKMVTVTTKYSGFVEKVHVNYIGQDVQVGDPLFEIYSPELVQTEQELLSALDYARRLEGASGEVRRRAEGLLQAARTRLRYWDITPDQIRRLEETREVFRTLTVTSPARGLVMKRMPGLEGMAISPGMEVLHLADLSSLWLAVEIFEDQLSWIEPGAEAEVRLTYYPGRTLTGRVLYLEPEVSEQTRSARLTLRVPNADGRLRVGMYATVVFRPVAVEQTLAVPSRAVLRTGERNVVVVALGRGRFVPREVTLGLEGEGFVQILAGLQAGQEVVTSAQFLIDSESNLREAIQKMIGGHAGH